MLFCFSKYNLEENQENCCSGEITRAPQSTPTQQISLVTRMRFDIHTNIAVILSGQS